MSEVTNQLSKNLQLSNNIIVDGVIVKGQSASINGENNAISFSDWINDINLYKANRTEIRKIETEFEDYAFSEQDKILDSDKMKEEITD